MKKFIKHIVKKILSCIAKQNFLSTLLLLVFKFFNKLHRITERFYKITLKAQNYFERIHNDYEKKDAEKKYIEKHHKIYKKTKKNLRKKLKTGKKIRIVFLGFNSGGNVDIYSDLYSFFMADACFEPIIVITPYTHDRKDGLIEKMMEAQKYLDKLGIEYINGYDSITDKFFDVYKCLNPDIVLFDCPYDWGHPFFKIDSFPPNKVLSYFMFYGYTLADNMVHLFGQKLSSYVYKIFPSAPIEIELFNKFSLVNGLNICQDFLGYPKVTKLLTKVTIGRGGIADEWKIKNKPVKRIIWAPHHIWAGYSNFLSYKDFMLELSKKYIDKIQFTFKPHPSLYDSLIEIAHWKKQDVDEYYVLWEKMANTQLKTDSWVDLFLTSDAMIMDSITFMAEYSLTGKPSCVITRYNSNGQREMKFNECGEMMFEKLYHASNNNEIINFIEDVVLDNNDYKKNERDLFIQKNYISEKSLEAAHNIYSYITKELGG